MEYSKKELEELIDMAEVNLNYLKDTGDGKGLIEKIDEEIPHLFDEVQLMSDMLIKVRIEWLSQRLSTIKDCIFATDDIEMAKETYNLVSPVWKKYVALDDFHKPYSAKEHEKNITATLDSIKRKIDRYYRTHPEQKKPTAHDFLAVLGGLTRDCLTYIEYKYDLRYKENPNTITVLSPNMQHKIFDVLPGQIASGFNEGVITLANLNKVIEEIETNIDNCKTRPELERYVVKLLEPFRTISNSLTIFQHESFEKQRAKIEEGMAKLGTPENCLIDLLFIMTKYANKLYAVLIQRDFDLGKFQDEVEIYLKREWTWIDIAPYVGGKIRAQRFMGQQETPIAHPSTIGREEKKTSTTPTVDREKMKNLFNESFLNLEYRPQDSVINDDKKTLFIEFCNRIDIILSSNDKKSKNKKNLGSIVYMIYRSKFTKPKYRKIEGKKGGFSILIKTFFDIVSLPTPKYTHPTYYNNPSKEIISYFGEILKWNN